MVDGDVSNVLGGSRLNSGAGVVDGQVQPCLSRDCAKKPELAVAFSSQLALSTRILHL